MQRCILLSKKIIYKSIIREAKRRENDKYILHVNHKSKAVWQIINKETGRTSNKQDINNLEF